MRPALRIAAILTAAWTTSACLSSSTLVKLKADGSGTIEQTILMNVKAMEMMAQNVGKALGAETQPEPSGPPKSFEDVMGDADFAKVATKLGPGVRFVSNTPLDRGDMKGTQVVFAFDDINEIAVSPTGAASIVGDAPREETAFRLSRQAGGHSLLTIDLPDAAKEAAGEDPQTEADQPDAGAEDAPPEMMEMMKQMLAGLKFELDVEVDGTIVKTNSDYVSGSRVTILQLDFDELLEQQDVLKKMPSLGRGTSFARMKEILRDVKGLKFSEPPVTIEFSGR